MENNILIQLVGNILGKNKPTSRGNYSYVCPFHTSNPPGKMNFEVNLTTNEKGENPWACWSCGARGKTLHSLLTKLKVDKELLEQVKIYTKYIPKDNNSFIQIEEIALPKEFISLINVSKNNIMAKHALNYLRKRHINQNDIIKYNIGFCEEGKYKNMIIVPSYDYNGKLNYFISRNFDKTSTLRYKNPPMSRDIIPFELFINWDLPITLCEGYFDLAAIKRNVIPLLGKNIQNNLMKKLIKSNVEKIYIVLDKDAQKKALEFCELLINEGKEVYLIDLEGKDPNETGFHKMINILQKSQPLTFSKLLENKLQLI